MAEYSVVWKSEHGLEQKNVHADSENEAVDKARAVYSDDGYLKWYERLNIVAVRKV